MTFPNEIAPNAPAMCSEYCPELGRLAILEALGLISRDDAERAAVATYEHCGQSPMTMSLPGQGIVAAECTTDFSGFED